MIMSKSNFEDDWDTATKNMEESKRDKQKWDNEKKITENYWHKENIQF